MKVHDKLAHTLSRWCTVIAFLFTPVDSSEPDGVRSGELCSFDRFNEAMGGIKLIFWLAISILVAFLLSSL